MSGPAGWSKNGARIIKSKGCDFRLFPAPQVHTMTNSRSTYTQRRLGDKKNSRTHGCWLKWMRAKAAAQAQEKKKEARIGGTHSGRPPHQREKKKGSPLSSISNTHTRQEGGGGGGSTRPKQKVSNGGTRGVSSLGGLPLFLPMALFEVKKKKRVPCAVHCREHREG